MTPSLEGRTAVITGGAGAIGGGVAARLAREGASVRILDLAEPTTSLFDPAADVDGRIVDVADYDAVSDALVETRVGAGPPRQRRRRVRLRERARSGRRPTGIARCGST